MKLVNYLTSLMERFVKQKWLLVPFHLFLMIWSLYFFFNLVDINTHIFYAISLVFVTVVMTTRSNYFFPFVATTWATKKEQAFYKTIM